MIDEVWKEIESYEGLYEVSSYGRIRSLPREVNHYAGGKALRKGTVLLPAFAGKGYLYVSLTKDGVSTTLPCHRIIAKAFVPNVDGKPHVNHIDGNKVNNLPENLQWCTAKENSKHAYDNGLITNLGKGRKHNAYKGDIVADNGTDTIIMQGPEDIRLAGFTQSSVYDCLNGKRLSHKGYTFSRVPITMNRMSEV